MWLWWDQSLQLQHIFIFNMWSYTVGNVRQPRKWSSSANTHTHTHRYKRTINYAVARVSFLSFSFSSFSFSFPCHFIRWKRRRKKNEKIKWFLMQTVVAHSHISSVYFVVVAVTVIVVVILLNLHLFPFQFVFMKIIETKQLL